VWALPLYHPVSLVPKRQTSDSILICVSFGLDMVVGDPTLLDWLCRFVHGTTMSFSLQPMSFFEPACSASVFLLHHAKPPEPQAVEGTMASLMAGRPQPREGIVRGHKKSPVFLLSAYCTLFLPSACLCTLIPKPTLLSPTTKTKS